MQITINGQSEDLDDEMSVAALLALRRLEPRRVAVEINEELVPRRDFGETAIRDGDRIEIVTFVGGG
jgi:sulfur carrier protein